jgi:hypothetical protein
MKTTLYKLGLFCSLLGMVVCAKADINVRVSVKFILGSSGQLPSNSGGFGAQSVALVNNNAVISNINYANELLRANGRGYQFQLTEIQNVSGWSSFFNLAARDGGNKAALENTATSNATTRAQFFWRDNAINVYINNTSSGYCSFPGDGSVIFIGSAAYDTLIIHEIGHYFSLAHTHSGEQFLNSDNSPCDDGCACAKLLGGNTDGFSDTLPDHECWNRAQMVAANPGASTTQIDNTFLNIMSYHLPQDRFTSGQLDAWADTGNSSRFNAVTGRTRFVDRDNTGIFQFGTSALPYETVAQGVSSAAASGDIVLIRPGHYNETMTITKALTLRATRGTAVIGLP